MPSDAKKRAQQKKKEQASNRNKKPVARVTAEENGSTTNGSVDRELTAEGIFIITILLSQFLPGILKHNRQ